MKYTYGQFCPDQEEDEQNGFDIKYLLFKRF